MSADFVMQSGVLVHVVAREYEAFMVQAAAIGSLAEDHVADGSCGSHWSFRRGSMVEAQLKQLALPRRVGWWLVCSSQVLGRATSGS